MCGFVQAWASPADQVLAMRRIRGDKHATIAAMHRQADAVSSLKGPPLAVLHVPAEHSSSAFDQVIAQKRKACWPADLSDICSAAQSQPGLVRKFWPCDYVNW